MAPAPVPGPTSSEPPRWALEQSMQEADAGESIVARAWDLVRAKQRRDDERHDEYDDPDQGGEGWVGFASTMASSLLSSLAGVWSAHLGGGSGGVASAESIDLTLQANVLGAEPDHVLDSGQV